MSENVKLVVDIVCIVLVATYIIMKRREVSKLKESLETRDFLLVEETKRSQYYSDLAGKLSGEKMIAEHNLSAKEIGVSRTEAENKRLTDMLSSYMAANGNYNSEITKLKEEIFELKHPLVFAMKPGTIIKIAGQEREFVRVEFDMATGHTSLFFCYSCPDGEIKSDWYDIDHVEAILRNTVA